MLLLRLFVSTFLYPSGHARNEVCVDPALFDPSLPDLNHFRARWPEIVVKKPVGNPYLGRQNLTYCCIEAIDEYLRNGCANTSQVQVDERVLSPDVQFPCRSTWMARSMDVPGVRPEVRVAFSWYAESCPGWQMSEPSVMDEPVQLLTSFILPAIVFSFSIPRSPKPRTRYMPSTANTVIGMMLAELARVLVATVCAAVDTVIWIIVAFSFAGPLIVSGIYEALLQKKVINLLSESTQQDKLPVSLRIRMLFALLCSSTDVEPRAIRQSNRRFVNSGLELDKTIERVAMRLRAILACQPSFGSTSLSTVVYFLVSFIWTLPQFKQSLRNEDVAKVLAYICWWMILSCMTVVGGLSLAGNNRDIVKATFSAEGSRSPMDENSTKCESTRLGTRSRTNKLYAKLMEKINEPTWMWNRAKCKQDWFLLLFADAWLKQEGGEKALEKHIRFADLLNNALIMGPVELILLWSSALLLVLVPCVSGFFIAHYTQGSGITCYSLIFLVYMGSQAFLLLLWTYHLTWRNETLVLGRRINRTLQGLPMLDNLASEALKTTIEKLQEQALEKIRELDSDNYDANSIFGRPTAYIGIQWKDKTRLLEKLLFNSLCTIGFGASLLSSIGGPFMEIIGLNTNALCLLKMIDWSPSPRDSTSIVLSATSAEQPYDVSLHFSIIGTFGMIPLCAITYIGWWHQKRLRTKFDAIVGKLDGGIGYPVLRNTDVLTDIDYGFMLSPLHESEAKLSRHIQTSRQHFSQLTSSKSDATSSKPSGSHPQRYTARLDPQGPTRDASNSLHDAETKVTNQIDSSYSTKASHSQASTTKRPQLVTWTCSCGEELSDYYNEIVPGAVDQLQRRLRHEHSKAAKRTFLISSILWFFGVRNSSQQTASTINDRTRSGSVTSGVSRGRSDGTHGVSAVSAASVASSSPLPITTHTDTSPPPATGVPPNSYLLLCFPEKFAGTKLHQEQITRWTGQPSSNPFIACDRDLFKQLRRVYHTTRKSRQWWPFWFNLHRIWPRTITRVSMAYFLVDYEKYVELRHYGCQADHTDCLSIPPTENTDYDFLPKNPPYRPPIATNYLTHYFQNPDCIQSTTLTVTLNQIPKRLSECFAVSGSKRIEAWGLEFEEGWHHGRLQKTVILLVFIGAVVFLTLWWGLEKDIQGASGMASFCIGSLAVLGYLATAEHRMVS